MQQCVAFYVRYFQEFREVIDVVGWIGKKVSENCPF